MQQEVSALTSWEEGTDRRGFLRRFGKAVAIGLGVALIPAAAASARSGSHCCRSSCAVCPSGFTSYTCFDQCSNSFCCVCMFDDLPNCLDKPCGACG